MLGRLPFFFLLSLCLCFPAGGCEQTDNRSLKPGTDSSVGADATQTDDSTDSAPNSTATDEDTGFAPGTDESTDTDTETVCDSQDFSITLLPTRLMILQDLSGSMTRPNGLFGKDLWDEGKAALTTMLSNPLNAAIEFGFDVFPDDADCGVDSPVAFDAQGDVADDIIAALDTFDASGNTPLCEAIRKFDPNLSPDYAPAFNAPGANRYLLIVTDGEASCLNSTGCENSGKPGSTQTRDRTAELLAQGIRTFVIGFKVGNSAQLTSIAKAGGTGMDTYIHVAKQQELQEALEGIAASVVSCTFEIDEPDAAADPQQVNFRFDGALVPMDDDCTQGSGWQWLDDAHTQVEFCEEACDKLQSGAVTNVSAEFGCPTEIVVPV